MGCFGDKGPPVLKKVNRFVHLKQHEGCHYKEAKGGANDISLVDGVKNHDEGECTKCSETAFVSNYVKTTKYPNALMFLPQNLTEQFMKKANFYFLITAIISLTPLSPKTPIVSIAPLLFVLMVSATKEALEDLARHRQDKEINATLVQTWRNGAFTDIKWEDVTVGDVVRVENEAYFPADIALLKSSEEQGNCSIETMNLDGETNLKVKKAARDVYMQPCAEDGMDHMSTFPSCLIQSSAPNRKMDHSSWTGSLRFTDTASSKDISLDMNSLLLRGCKLKNTKWIIGCVIFTGTQTKLALNSAAGKHKRSNVERIIDRALYVLFTLQGLLCTFGMLANLFWMQQHEDGKWYLPYYWENPTTADLTNEAGLSWFTYLVLLDILVPISLYVSVEMVKIFQAFLIDWDVEMYDERTDTPAAARTSNLNEELGQVNYIFSDKTGTLTQNMMNFLLCTVGGKMYGGPKSEDQKDNRTNYAGSSLPALEDSFPFKDPSLFAECESEGKRSGVVNHFLTCLSVNHSVAATFPTCDQEHVHSFGECKHTIDYQASSPDEKALVIAAKNNCFYFYHREPREVKIGGVQINAYHVHVNIMGTTQVFELLEEFEFNSTRARMSVIVRDPRDGEIRLYCKGSDTALYKLLDPDEKENKWSTTNQHLQSMGEQGLRTLVLGYKTIPEATFIEWFQRHQKAKATVGAERFELVEASETELDTGLMLIGATAIEDQLQDGVPETIASLAQADIKIWMLTGDKTETAVNIGKSCKLITPGMSTRGIRYITVSEDTPDEKAAQETFDNLDAAFQDVKDSKADDNERAVVVSGRSLGYIFGASQVGAKKKKLAKDMSPEEIQRDEELRSKFLTVLESCKAVICCRVSPSQKAEVVSLVRTRVPTAITLAIGDGANDVSMIKKAHVGIGISGLEGLQAVMSSDYAIAQFKFLKRLLFIHGAWSYQRTSCLILYSFYKNIAIAMTQMFFAFDSAFSAQMFYDAYCGSVYNMFFTSFPIMFLAVLNQDIQVENTLSHPKLYTSGHRNEFFSVRLLLHVILESTIMGAILYYGSVYFFNGGGTGSQDGIMDDQWVVSTFMYATLIVVVNIKVTLETTTITIFSAGIIIFSIIAWYIWSYFYEWLAWTPDFAGVSNRLYGQTVYIIAQIATTAMCCIPMVVQKFVQREYFTTYRHVIQEQDRGYFPPGVVGKKHSDI